MYSFYDTVSSRPFVEIKFKTIPRGSQHTTLAPEEGIIMLTKLQFKLAKMASDEARAAIEAAQKKALFENTDIIVKCSKNPQILEEMANMLGFETELKQVEFGYEIRLI